MEVVEVTEFVKSSKRNIDKSNTSDLFLLEEDLYITNNHLNNLINAANAADDLKITNLSHLRGDDLLKALFD